MAITKHKDLVDQDKSSYQIVLGSNGTVYYVTNYRTITIREFPDL